MCRSSWLLVEKVFPHITQTNLPGTIPRRGSSCSGGTLGNFEGFLIFLPYGGFLSIKLIKIKPVCGSLKRMWLQPGSNKPQINKKGGYAGEAVFHSVDKMLRLPLLVRRSLGRILSPALTEPTGACFI